MLVRLRHRAHLPPVPSARPVRRADHRADLNHALPRGRPIQDELRGRPGRVPDPAGPHRARRHPVHRRVVIPWFGSSIPDPGGHDSVPDFLARGHRAESADRLYRAAVARHRRLHGCRRLRLLQAHDLFSRREHHHLDRSRRASSRRRSAFCSDCRRCGSRDSISRWRRWRRSSSCPGASSGMPGSTITMYPARSRCRRASLFGVPITGATATPIRRAISSCSAFVVVMTWIASNLVHGRIGRMWMAVRDMDIAAELIGIRLLPTKLLAFAASSFYCGVAGALLVFLWYGGAEPDGIRHQPELLHPVHGHHRRPRQPDRLVLRRRPDLHPADRPAVSCRPSSACRFTLRQLSTSSS